MHPEMTRQLAAQHIAELQQQAATWRLVRGLRASQERESHRRRSVWERLRLRQPREATVT
jgi:uncharacterized caspase-like protein